jgi:hypothetical protein
MKRRGVEVRFWPKVDRRGPDECWPWIAKAVCRNGYGRMSDGRHRQLRAHRIAYELANGPVPEGLDVCHSCDNPPCCNPAHLFLGTAKDNMADAKRKGRTSPPPHYFGEDHHNAKFGHTAALAILSDTRPAQVVAADYGVSAKTVYALWRGDTWEKLIL